MKKENVVVKNQVILNAIQDLQRLLLLLLNDMRGRFQIKFGMTSLFNNGGFTLIELLVVVLIIGILAAVAVPQYQRAVEKSKATQALSVLKSLAQATRSYYLANGKYPTKFEQLDVDMSAWTGNTQVHQVNIQDVKSNEDWSLHLWSDDPGNNIIIMILRTSGKYRSAGFFINCYQSFSITCVEDFSADFPSSQEGTYCQKLFNGTVIDPTNAFRQYRLP